MTVKAVHGRGILRPLKPLDLEEGQEIDISVLPPAEEINDAETQRLRTQLEASAPGPQKATELLLQIAEFSVEPKDVPETASIYHDRYLYGDKRGAW